ncbi:MAG TPA: NAD(P)H-binding protein [Pseudonocardiaceae bacterium]
MILITGATGLVGRPIVELLLADGQKVAALTRDPDAAALPDAAELVAGDPSRPETVPLDGIDTVFLNARAVGESADALVAHARRHGVRRLVALAAINVDDDLALQPSRANGDRNKEVEQAVVGSGLEWVSLRPTSFATNTIGMWARQIRAGDLVRGPYATAADSPIDPRDVAEVAARALVGDELLGRKPVLTGPASLTQDEMVATIGRVLGRPLRFQEVPPEVARQAMANVVSQDFADAFVARLAACVGRPVNTDEVATILGHPATSFADWVARNAAAFQD